MYSIKKFNDAGLTEFERLINEIRAGNLDRIPDSFLFDSNYIVTLEPVVNIERVLFKNKYELIPYICSKLNLKSNKELYFDKGLWSWLSAFFFDNICPEDEHGKRKINESAYYILRDPKEYTKYYRHLLAYYSRLYSEVGESSKLFLAGTFQTRGEISEQLGASQEIALNSGILKAANILFWDESAKSFKRGAASNKGGSVRRFVRIIKQYQMTFDLNSMSGEEIAALLPDEFAKWK